MNEQKFRRLCRKHSYGVAKTRGRDKWTIYSGEKTDVTEPEFVGTFNEAVAWLSSPDASRPPSSEGRPPTSSS
jgi:hypothetical protein